MNLPATIHLRPPLGQLTRRDYTAGRALCGKRSARLTSDRSFVTCTNCQAAHDADQENTP